MSSKSKLAKKGDSAAKRNQTDFLKEFRNRKVANKSAHPPGASHDATSSGASSRVTHPFAKYNASGQLQCMLCSLQIATDKAWPFHLQSRKHKDIMSNLKMSTSRVPRRESGPTAPSRTERGGPGRVLTTHTELTTNQPANKLKSILKVPQAALAPDSDGTAPSTEAEAAKPLQTPASKVPADFFDTPSSLPASNIDTADTNAPAADESQHTTAGGGGDGKLPEGFFDDPKRDAKVRGVKPEEAMEREWEAFQRLMETENEQSELIVAEQDHLIQLERDFTETHQQSGFFNRAEDLRNRQEALVAPQGPAAEGAEATGGGGRVETGEPSDDDTHPEFELELDWRAQAH